MSSVTDILAPDDKASAADKLGMGSPARTLALRKEYMMAREDRDINWADFLSERGYAADPNGNAYKLGAE